MFKFVQSMVEVLKKYQVGVDRGEGKCSYLEVKKWYSAISDGNFPGTLDLDIPISLM